MSRLRKFRRCRWGRWLNKITNPMRILIVDDDPAICEISARILAHSGFSVDIAPDGESAWDAVGVQRYDLILTDQNMPRLDGTGFIGRLRAAGLRIPVILMTGAAVQIPEKTSAPDCFLTKPFSFSVLLEEVNRLLCPVAV